MTPRRSKPIGRRRGLSWDEAITIALQLDHTDHSTLPLKWFKDETENEPCI